MKVLLRKAATLLLIKREDIERKRRIKKLQQEGKDIFQEAMGRVVCQKPSGNILTQDSVKDEIYSV